MAVKAWDASSVQNFQFNENPSVLPAVYNHRMTKINLTAYSFGGIDGKSVTLEVISHFHASHENKYRTDATIHFFMLCIQNHLSA
jgi:hypothetical protein